MRRLRAAAAVAVLTLAGGVAAGSVAAPALADSKICAKYGSTPIQGGKYIVQNNVWGDDTTQCMTVTSTGFKVTSAAHKLPQNGAPGAYPSVYAGCHWGNCSSASGLPLPVSDRRFSSISTSVSMSYPTNGSVYDAAYDVWFDPTPRTDGQNTGAELMVWLNKTGKIHAAGKRVATVKIAGATWDVWFDNYGWNVVSYVRRSAATSMNLKVATFYQDMVKRKYAKSTWYITSVQAGFEPWVNGTGLAVKKFSYSMSGIGKVGCKVGYTNVAQTTGGFVAILTVTNKGTTPIYGWNLHFALSGDQQITKAWGAAVKQDGTSVAVTNAPNSGPLAAGASTVIAVQGTSTAADAADPTSFTLNGTACSIG